MRVSPVLLAAFTVSAVIGLPSPARAQVPDLALSNPENLDAPEPSDRPAAVEGSDFSDDFPDAVSPPETVGVDWLLSQSEEPSPDLEPQEVETPASEEVPTPEIEPAEIEAQPPVDPLEDPLAPESQQIEVPLDEPLDEQIELESSPSTEPPSEAIEEDIEPDAPAEEPEATETQPEAEVLVAEVLVIGVEGDLQIVVYDAIETRPGRTATRSQLQDDINAVFATGYFSNVRVTPSDTPLGVRVTYEVTPNPILQTVQVEGSQVLPPSEIEDAFGDQYGEILNLNLFQDGVEQLNQWYQDNGYVLAQVVEAPAISPDGVVTLQVVEGIIEDLEVKFIDADGQEVDEDGEPIEGRTREFIITREFETQPGDVFNQADIERDLQRVYGLGIFDDVRLALNPGDDPRKVDLVVNVTERNTGSIAAGLGLGSEGIFGTLSYQEQNFGGNNQRLTAEVQVGLRDFAFDIDFTDPWIGGDPYRTSYTISAFNRFTISSIFDGGEREVTLPDEDEPDDIDEGDRPRVNRLGLGVRFTRPLDEWLGWQDWTGSLGFQYQHVSIRDADNDLAPVDALGNDLSFSGEGEDDLFMFQLGLVRDRRNSLVDTTSGSLLRLSTDQTLPIGQGSIFMNRMRASYSVYFPVDFTSFSEDGGEALAFNIQGGTILGDLPPYEAFPLGGTDSVRGYDFGDLGTGRSYLQATAEYRFPIFSIVRGALFVDFGTDLGTASDVPGEPAEVRDKPGTGFGYGLGIRLQTPLGPIRLDYGINDDGDGRFHFGLGERF